MASQQLSNVIGAPFAEHILTQLNLRAAHNSTGDGNVPSRSNEEILFLANKMSWVKLTSSVSIKTEADLVPGFGTLKYGLGLLNVPTLPLSKFYENLFNGQVPLGEYSTPESLAKNWILEAGTSKANGKGIDQRYGIGPDGAYGLGGTNELGYRPMPGLTSVTIDTKGTLGSLREATIQFKVWNMTQLNIVEALYFRLGYSMLLEWGHNQFFTNVNKQGGGGTFTTNAYGIDPFQKDLRKEQIQQQIAKRSYELSGNYDGMLGIVTNFNWSFNQTGGYDCTIRLVGLGAIMDSLKINLSYVMPPAILQQYKSMSETIEAEEERRAKIAADNAEATKRKAAKLPTLPATPTNPQEIYTKIYTADKGIPTNPPPGQDTFLAEHALPIAYNADPANKVLNTVYDYYYKATTGGKEGDVETFKKELNEKRTGLFLSPVPNLRETWQLVPTENYPKVVLSGGLLNTAAIFNSNNELGVSGNAVDLSDRSIYISKQKFTRLFDLAILKYRATNLRTALYDLYTLSFQGIQPKDPIYAALSVGGSVKPVTETLSYNSNVNDPYFPTQQKQVSFSITLSYKPSTVDSNSAVLVELDKKKRPTREELVNAFDNWLSSDRTVQITSIENKTGTNDVLIKGDVTLSIPGKPVAVVNIEFTNTALIQSVLASPVAEGTPQNAKQNANAGDNGGTDNKSEPQQTDPGYRFASALHAMLAVAKSQVEYEMTKNQEGVVPVPLEELTKKFYQGSILENFFDTAENPATSGFDLIQYAKKGFNSSLMVNYKDDPALFSKIPSVVLKDLCTAYGIRWEIQNSDSKINYPAYIKLGYILSFLNAMCLVYDSTQDTDKHPYVYLDFNPYTNFCLTMPQHMSVDPFTCIIPYQGTQADYLKLFPPDVAPNQEIIESQIFGEKLNALSGWLPKFKASTNPYQGSTMEILLNIDFLVEALNARTTKSSDYVVDLKGFLDDIMTGINKSTGNLNSFRVAYRDDSNTVVIKDDQFVPPMEQEKNEEDGWIMNVQGKSTNYQVPNGVNVPKYGQLPIFGKYSLVREMKLETNMSTAMSSIIAISAQADTGSVNSKDHTAFSWLNGNFQDRYKPRVSDSSGTNSQPNNNQPTPDEIATAESNSNKAAAQFNQHVVSIYAGGTGTNALSRDKVGAAINYYINGIAQVKSEDRITVAAPFIPANLNITIDGIAGIIMGNAFTIPQDRLPFSLRGPGGTDNNTKVGFIVVGLTHTLDNNQWLTRIRGQMIKLRDSDAYGVTQKVQGLQNTFIADSTVSPTTFTGDAFEDAVNFVKQQENLASIRKVDTSGKSRGVTYAPKNPSPSLILYPYNLEGKPNKDGSPSLTIGWGTNSTFRAGTRAGKYITANDTITVKEAEENLRVELAILYREVLAAARKYNLTPTTGQVVGLLSLGYNAGLGGMRSSPLWEAFIGKRAPNKDATVRYRITADFSGPLAKRRALEYNAYIS